MENMENIINQIINIEERAQSLTDDAERMKLNLQSSIDKDIESIRNDIKNKVQKKYETIKSIEQDYADKKINELSAAYSDAESKLDEVCKNKKDEWVSSLYESVVGIV